MSKKVWVGLTDSTLHPKKKEKELKKCVDCSALISKLGRSIRCIPCQDVYASKLAAERNETRRLRRKNEKSAQNQ